MLNISIIVPVYNVDEYLEKCIQSILNQTFKNYELILVNDGSTDLSGEICDKYKKIDNRIKVIHKKNGGLSSARNAGLDIALGEYIAFVDSDDSIHPQMYEILFGLIKKYDADISCCSFKKVYNTSHQNYDKVYSSKIYEMNNIQAVTSIDKEYIGVRLVIACNKLYNRSLFKNLRYNIGRIHEDEFMAHRILYKCRKLIYIDEDLYYYLQRSGSIMSNRFSKSKVDALMSLSDRIKFFEEVGLKELSYKVLMIYENKFFDIYSSIKSQGKEEGIFLKELRKDFIFNLNRLFKLKQISIKQKVLWILFVINPRIYNIYYKNK